jgi:hypothetical protein
MFGKISPRSACAEHLEDAVEDATAALPGPSTSVRAARWLGNEGIEGCPLEISQVSSTEKRHKIHSRQVAMELLKSQAGRRRLCGN